MDQRLLTEAIAAMNVIAAQMKVVASNPAEDKKKKNVTINPFAFNEWADILHEISVEMMGLIPDTEIIFATKSIDKLVKDVESPTPEESSDMRPLKKMIALWTEKSQADGDDAAALEILSSDAAGMLVKVE